MPLMNFNPGNRKYSNVKELTSGLIPIQLMIATNPLVETLQCNVSTWSICHILFLNWYYAHSMNSSLRDQGVGGASSMRPAPRQTIN